VAITKRAIILERLGTNPLMFRYALWADVPATRQAFYAAKQVGMVSAWKDALPGDNIALQNGSVTEYVDQATFAAGTTQAQAQAVIQDIWTQYQAAVTASNPWLRYGSFMDTTNTWTMGGVS
jgi:hypothetical protein